MGFQDARIPAHSQDLVIGNFPFNKEGWSGDKYPFSLHNQFFARSLDLTAPGGLIVAITSDSTMDSPASAGFRRWMAQRADLVGAIRLPNDTFTKNAGTEVTTDILVFRKKDAQPFDRAEAFINTRPMETGKTVAGVPETVEVNEYYHRHPDMMLGRMTREGTMYEADSPALIAHPTSHLCRSCRKRCASCQRASPARAATRRANDGGCRSGPGNQKEGSYQISNGKVCQVRGGELATPDFGDDILSGETGGTLDRASRWRQGLVRQGTVRPVQRPKKSRPREWRFGGSYDAYVHTYGRVNKSSRVFQSDPEWSIPAALEKEVTQKYQARLKTGKQVDRLRQAYVPADILSKRVLYPASPPDRAESVADAATISRSWRGTFDPDYMARLLGKSPDDVKQDIIAKGLGFEDPATGQVVPKDEYLSGNVREKLRVATEAVDENPQYQGNVEALQAVQPEPLKNSPDQVQPWGRPGCSRG